jgi:hypothetical protein
MLSARFVTVFGLAATVGFIIANCGGSDSSSTPSGLACPTTSGGSCSAAENKAYGDCIQNKCDGAYQMCLGSGYKSGSFSGACGAWIGCYAKCNCDKACQANCGQPSGECTTCLTAQVSPCVLSSGCAAPACTGGGTGGSGGGTGGSGGGGTGTCSDLMKCCAAIADASQKSACQNALTGAMMAGDQYCGLLLTQFRASKLCP